MPFLRSEYGKDYDYEAPVKLLDAMMHAQADRRDQQARYPSAEIQASECGLSKGRACTGLHVLDSCLRLCSTGGNLQLMPAFTSCVCSSVCNHALECVCLLDVDYALLGWSALSHELRGQVVVLAQVLAADINIGYEEGLVNTQVCNTAAFVLLRPPLQERTGHS